MAKNKITAVINTLNEEKNLAKCLESLSFCDEIVVVDMISDDKTKQIAKRFTDKVYDHKRTGYVEPARNFAIEKATSEYILIIDADETVPKKLGLKLRELCDQGFDGYVLIPRSNYIFGGTLKHSGWWPDYNVRFFKKGRVKWSDKIHSVPQTTGEKLVLPEDVEMALHHNNYPSVSSYLSRLDRYTSVQANELIDQKLEYKSFFIKPWAEFLRRYFAMKGYKDGVRGLILSVLQAFSEYVVMVKVWELQDYPEIVINDEEVLKTVDKAANEYKWWHLEKQINEAGSVKRMLLKIKRRI